MSKMDELINKSLDEIDAIAEEIKKGNILEDISKGVNDEDLSPGEVSDDAVDQGEESPEESPEASEEGDDADVDEDTEPEEDEAEDEEVEKSLEDDLKSNEGIKKALEVSEFLESITKSISNILSIHSNKLSKSLEASEEVNESLAKSFAGIAKSQKVVLETQAQILKSLNTLTSRVKQLEKQPQVRKSVASTAQIVEKSFATGTPATAAANTNTGLTKSEVSAKLFQGVQEGKILPDELLAFESLGTIGALSSVAQQYISGK